MTPIILAAILFQLRAVPTYKISGRVTTLPGVALPQSLTLRKYGQGAGPLNLTAVPVQANGTFQIGGAAAGEYSLSLGDPFRFPSRNFTFGGGDVTDLEIKVPTTVAGRIVLTDGRAFSGDFAVSAVTQVTATNITPGSPKTMVSRTSPDGSGNFTLAVFPGDNIIGVGRLPDGYTVASVTYNGTDLQHNPLRLTATPTSTVVVTVTRIK